MTQVQVIMQIITWVRKWKSSENTTEVLSYITEINRKMETDIHVSNVVSVVLLHLVWCF